jgi:hypothetical protein
MNAPDEEEWLGEPGIRAVCRDRCRQLRRRVPPTGADVALSILEPYVHEVVDAFREIGADRITGLRVEITTEAGDDGRHFAACSTDGDLIIFSPDIVALPPATILALVAHEFGHAADFLYPAQWVQTRGGLRLLDMPDNPYVQDEYGKVRKKAGARRPPPERLLPVTGEMVRDWKERDEDEVELMADALAEEALGEVIGYRGPCMLQTVGSGVRPRPKGLR